MCFVKCNIMNIECDMVIFVTKLGQSYGHGGDKYVLIALKICLWGQIERVESLLLLVT